MCRGIWKQEFPEILDNENKRTHFKTICIIEKGNGTCNERQTQRNQFSSVTTWNFETLCHTAIRTAKKQYNNYIQQISPKEKYIQPRNVKPKLSSMIESELSENETLKPKEEKIIHPKIHPDILLKLKVLFFMMIESIQCNHYVIPISNNTIPNDKQKLLIVIADQNRTSPMNRAVK